MTWSEWVLIYLVPPIVICLIIGTGDYRDAMATLFIWPLVLWMFPYTRYQKWKRERARQARITARVAGGVITREYAIDSYRWKPPRK